MAAHRTDGGAGVGELGVPLRRGLRREQRRELLGQPRLPAGRVHERVGEVGTVDRGAERGPGAGLGRGEGDELPVGGAVRAAATPPRPSPAGCPTATRATASPSTHVALSTIDVSTNAPRPGAVAFGDRGEDADDGDERTERHREHEVGRGRHGVARHQRHEPRVAEEGDVVRRPLGVRTALAEAGDRAPHEPGLVGGEGGVVDALRGERRGQARLHHDVDLGDQTPEHVGRVGVLQVERHRALAPVVRLHGARDHAGRVAGAARLDAEHVGAEVGEHARCSTHPGCAREVEHAEVRERSVPGVMRASGLDLDVAAEHGGVRVPAFGRVLDQAHHLVAPEERLVDAGDGELLPRVAHDVARSARRRPSSSASRRPS